MTPGVIGELVLYRVIRIFRFFLRVPAVLSRQEEEHVFLKSEYEKDRFKTHEKGLAKVRYRYCTGRVWVEYR